jgi:hypothetical protein
MTTTVQQHIPVTVLTGFLGPGISQVVKSPNDQLVALGTEAGVVSVCTPQQQFH